MKIVEGSSFRDPEGFVYSDGSEIFRHVNFSYKNNLDMLMDSGLYAELTLSGCLIRHEEAAPEDVNSVTPYKTLKPERLPFISYPYEWSFSQLKDAALLTLKIQKISLEKGMSLRDASAYNIQFKGPDPIFIDTLSFEKYREGEPWPAYGQFCRHFLAPLGIAAAKDARLIKLLRDHVDGIPLDLASKMLPFKTRFNPGLLAHIHLHAAAVGRFGGSSIKRSPRNRLGKFALLGIIDSLESTVKALNEGRPAGEWAGYYENTNYTDEAFADKKRKVLGMLQNSGAKGGVLWDLGANTGVLSSLAAEAGFYAISFDLDQAAVGVNYRGKSRNVLPLVMDLCNPSPALGWAHRERKSLAQRGPADCVMALALIHHLALANQVPFEDIALFFSGLTRGPLIIEFVQPEDPRAGLMLENNPAMRGRYNAANFESAFKRYFNIVQTAPVAGSLRTLYLMEKPRKERVGP